MQRFEMLSRSNGSYNPTLIDEDEDYVCKPQRPKSRDRQSVTQRPFRTNSEDRGKNVQVKNDCLSKRPAYKPTPFTRSAGYVEKVVKYMDPMTCPEQGKLSKFQNKMCNTKWELDPRSGEWYKVCDRNFDFENNFPPLPPPPPASKDSFPCPTRKSCEFSCTRQNSLKFNGPAKACNCTSCNCRDKRF